MSVSKCLKAWVIGASGYSGAELCRLLATHPSFTLVKAFGSSERVLQPFETLYPQLKGQLNLDLSPWSDAYIAEAHQVDVVFLALPHEVSASLAPRLLQAGVVVIDLSGAFRLQELNKYPEFYGFIHPTPRLVGEASYSLIEMLEAASLNNLISVPGCYPTVSTLALLPLVRNKLLNQQQVPVITATSGVSGAGRKAAEATSFCEVSLRSYGVLSHRHQPEIEQNLGCEVIFTPQLGAFKRGILATCVARLQADVSVAAVNDAFHRAYHDKPFIRLVNQPPSVAQVENLPFCDIHWAVQGDRIVVSGAIDNLLKGAASQAIQAANMKFGLPQKAGLLA